MVIRWLTDLPATSQVDYGVGLILHWRTPLDPALTTVHAVTVKGLLPGITYRFRVRSVSEVGLEAVSRVRWFRTRR